MSEPRSNSVVAAAVLTSAEAALTEDFLVDVPGVARQSASIGATRWTARTFTSGEPLCGEEAPADAEQMSYQYPLWMRLSGARVVLASIDAAVVEKVMNGHITGLYRPALYRIHFAVDDFVDHLVMQSDAGESGDLLPYHLTTAHGAVPSYRQQLRSVSFYGEDLSRAGMFVEHIRAINFHMCGVRESPPTLDEVRPGHFAKECARISTRGNLTFRYVSRRSLPQIERFLRVLRDRGFLLGPDMHTSWESQ